MTKTERMLNVVGLSFVLTAPPSSVARKPGFLIDHYGTKDGQTLTLYKKPVYSGSTAASTWKSEATKPGEMKPIKMEAVKSGQQKSPVSASIASATPSHYIEEMAMDIPSAGLKGSIKLAEDGSVQIAGTAKQFDMSGQPTDKIKER